jgi:hypothetical protein
MRNLLVVALLCGLSFMFWGFLWMSFPYIAQENQIIENIQAFCLLVGFVLYFYLFFKSGPGSYSILFIGLGLFYLTFAMRELELEEGQTWIAIVTNPPVRNYWLTASWAVSFLIFLRNMKNTFNVFLEWIKEIQGIFLIFGGLFYLSADLFDKNVFSISREENLFIEESLEFNATIFMTISAVYSLLWAKKQVWWYGAGRFFR